MADRIKIVVGDITKLEVDAIVNAANQSLLGGGGVDGAIHRAAGSLLLEECISLGGCETGQSKITGAYNLPSKFVIHTVGPVYHLFNKNRAAELLASCYRSALLLAGMHGLRSIAFPCISCGVFGYPVEEASKVALRAIKESEYDGEVIICCFSEADASCYLRQISTL